MFNPEDVNAPREIHIVIHPEENGDGRNRVSVSGSGTDSDMVAMIKALICSSPEVKKFLTIALLELKEDPNFGAGGDRFFETVPLKKMGSISKKEKKQIEESHIKNKLWAKSKEKKRNLN